MEVEIHKAYLILLVIYFVDTEKNFLIFYDMIKNIIF